MTKYPLDNKAIENIANDLIRNHQAQNVLMGFLIVQLKAAMEDVDNTLVDGFTPGDWRNDADLLIKEIETRTKDFDNLRFDQQNGHKDGAISPYESKEVDHIFETEDHPDAPMTEEELAKHFGEKLPKKKKGKDVNKMTLEEIQEWEAKQNNNNDIYKVAARVKNLARGSKASLTPVGESLCNTFVHVLKTFYDFADTIQDKEVKMKLIELVRAQEGTPSNFIEAVHAGVRG